MDEHTQDGMTADQWLDHMFSTEYCDCCGLDKEDHVVTGSPTGHFFAFCKSHPGHIGGKAYVARYREVRGEDPEDVEEFLNEATWPAPRKEAV